MTPPVQTMRWGPVLLVVSEEAHRDQWPRWQALVDQWLDQSDAIHEDPDGHIPTPTKGAT